MSDPRPLPATEWEEDNKRDADVAVENADRAVLHADEAMADLVESSKQIAADSAAVQKMTRESVIADNKKFRRRNTVLMVCVALLLISQIVQQARYYLDTKPQNDEQSQILESLEDNQDDLNELVLFVREVRDNPTDGGVTREELQVVFEAVFETKALVECVIAAPDAETVKNCGQE